MKWSFLTTLAIVSIYCAAQDKQSSTPVFTASTSFVQVPVIVQRSGKHVRGLTRESFTLQQDGKTQPIATFQEVHAAPAVRAKIGEGFANTYATGQIPQQITILAIDTVNTPPLDQAYFKKELESYLSEAKAEGSPPIGLVELKRNGMHVLHDFTTDPKALMAASQKQKTKLTEQRNQVGPQINEGASAAGQQEALSTSVTVGRTLPTAAADQKQVSVFTQAQDTENQMIQFQDRAARIDTLLALQQLAQALKGIPGRKTLLWVGSGFQLMGGVGEIKRITDGSFNLGKVGEALDQVGYTWKLLNDANVAVYPIDTRRTVNTAYQTIDPSRKYSPLASDRAMAEQADRETIDTFKSVAAETGGKPCIYRTDLGNCIREAAEDDRDYYLLGFYADKENRKPGWHKISVKVSEKANVRHRQGFIIASVKAENTRATDLQLAINSPFSYTEIPFAGNFTGSTGDGSKKKIGFEIRIPPDAITVDDSHINFDVVAVVRAAGGKEAARLGQRIDRRLQPENVTEIRAHGINYKNKVELPPGDYGVWFVLRDNPTGRTGSLAVPLKVE